VSRSKVDTAERVAWRRAWLAIGLGVLFALTQLLSLRDPVIGSSVVIHLAAWYAWAAALAVFLAWAGGLLRGRALDALLNDEGGIEHRRRALAFGFWGAVLAAFLLYAFSFYETVSGRDACRWIVTCAVAPALLRFGWLEIRALRSDD